MVVFPQAWFVVHKKTLSLSLSLSLSLK